VKAAILSGPRSLQVSDVSVPRRPEGWSLVRTVAVGICGTDKAFYAGTYPLPKKPLVPGHEVVGIVVEGSRELVGRTVVPEINFPCWSCGVCRLGMYTHCPHKKTLGIDFDGGMAEFFVAPEAALHVVEGLDPGIATEVEPLAALIHGLRVTPVGPETSVAIVGTGNLAYLLYQLLTMRGARPVIFARRGSVKGGILSFSGLRVETAEEYPKALEDTWLGLGFDVVFEVSGDPSALDFAVEIARPRGIVHLKSTPGSVGFVNLTRAVVKEVQVATSRCGDFRDFEEAIRLLRGGQVKPRITSVFTGVESAPEAFEKSLERGQFKVVVQL
jgi:alcohol dehydrogenase